MRCLLSFYKMLNANAFESYEIILNKKLLNKTMQPCRKKSHVYLKSYAYTCLA